MRAEELNFPPTAGFGKWKNLFPKKSIEFPAKANLNLVQFLIEEFTERGDTVLDVMCGTASTCVMASLAGRHGVGVELEKKYVEWALEAKRRTEATLGEKGEIKIIQGDSRELSKVLGMVDSIITSPPYAETIQRVGGSSHLEHVGVSTKTSREYSSNPENIGNLPSGNVDAVITSPPYSESRTEMGGEKGKRGGDSKFRVKKDYVNPEEENNISRLPHGNIDAVITSPPYEGILSGDKDGPGATSIKNPHGFKASSQPTYTEEKTWTEKHKIDAVITSPPYADQEVGKAIRPNRWAKIKDREGFKGRKAWKEGEPSHYSNSKNNIGNLKKENYFEAMQKVYEESWKVLKPNGRIIIILKNFIRNKAVVDLVYDSYRLLGHVGFKLEKVYKLKLKNESFWRILNRRKYPGTPKLGHEYVLVFSKAPA